MHNHLTFLYTSTASKHSPVSDGVTAQLGGLGRGLGGLPSLQPTPAHPPRATARTGPAVGTQPSSARAEAHPYAGRRRAGAPNSLC